MESSFSEFIKCPYCSVLIPRNSTYCLNCGKRVRPRTYLFKIRGLSIFSEAIKIFSKNLKLLFPVLFSVLLSLFTMMSNLSIVYADSYITDLGNYFLFWVLPSLLFLAISLFILIMVEGWLAVASIHTVQVDNAKIKKSLRSAINKRLTLLKIALFYFAMFLTPNLILLPFILIFRKLPATVSLIPSFVFLIIINILLMYLVPLSMLKDAPFNILLNESIELFIDTFKLDKKFVIIVTVFYIIFYSTLPFIFLINFVLLVPLTVYSIIVLARVLYLKINFMMF